MKQKYKCHRTCDLEGKLDMYLHDNPSPTTMKECKCIMRCHETGDFGCTHCVGEHCQPSEEKELIKR